MKEKVAKLVAHSKALKRPLTIAKRASKVWDFLARVKCE
jgi:hypothetical protein